MNEFVDILVIYVVFRAMKTQVFCEKMRYLRAYKGEQRKGEKKY